jgi:hypothetical protein
MNCVIVPKLHKPRSSVEGPHSTDAEGLCPLITPLSICLSRVLVVCLANCTGHTEGIGNFYCPWKLLLQETLSLDY